VGEAVTLIDGLYWPDDVAGKWKHSLKHVKSVEWAMAACRQHRTAVQAGGNIGIWPRRMAEVFDRVYTFEPEPISRACLERNVFKNVTVSAAALGAMNGRCSIERKSLGSHCVTEGSDVPMVTLDSYELQDLDLLQLDVEGYEWHALMGAVATIIRCHPLIQVELRGFTQQYGHSDTAVRKLLASLGYQVVTEQPGNDFVFRWKP
jgi:FkbM family methyltransferase